MPTYNEFKDEIQNVSPLLERFSDGIQGKILQLLAEKYLSEEAPQRMEELEIAKLKHDALLSEIHNIDGTTETHAATVIAISTALIAFAAYNLGNREILLTSGVLGIFIAMLWWLKTLRHRDIFRACRDDLKAIQFDGQEISAFRPLRKRRNGKHIRIFSRDGFTLLMWFAFVLIVFWLTVFIGVLVFDWRTSIGGP